MTKRLLITCDCGRKFRGLPEYKFNSTIKNKQPRSCKICENKKILFGDKPTPKKEDTKDTKAKKPRKKYVKWEDKPLKDLIQYVQIFFCNPYIRARDTELFGKCISCNSRITQAGHRFPTGSHPGMRFMVNNIHGQEVSCNMYKHGNLDLYDKGLIARHGEDYLRKLKHQESMYSRGSFKFNRFDVIEIGKTYKYLLKNKIWIFDQEDFNDERNKLLK